MRRKKREGEERGSQAHSKGNKCAEDRVPGRLPHHGATVERGLNFPWFNWARNHFRCNTRADAAATSSNHRKSSTSLSPFSSLIICSLPFSLLLSAIPLNRRNHRVPNPCLAISAVCYRVLRVFAMHFVWLKYLLDCAKSGFVITSDDASVATPT